VTPRTGLPRTGLRGRAALAATAPLIDALGGAEDLDAHVQAVRARVPREGTQP
jgi:hypothetical protein